MSRSNIEYVDHVINLHPYVCRQVSHECRACYMFAMATRFNKEANPHTDPLVMRERPAKWREIERAVAKMPAGDTVFVHNLSDTYLERVTDHEVWRVHDLIARHPDKTFAIVTKRVYRAYHMRHRLPWPDNLWLIVTVGHPNSLDALPYALATPARHVGVSAEPLLGRLLALEPFLRERVPLWYFGAQRPRFVRGIEWVIVGGESGDRRRPLDYDWAREIVAMRRRHPHVSLFYKQGNHRLPGRDDVLDGQRWKEIPAMFGGAGPTGPATVPLAEPVRADGVTQHALPL